ncbi:MAG: aminomethyl transferase family protein [Clostridiales bacterium]|jgi:aminomethyltransferase|nr:aminomethyl transferase family protein [Clostridiales bacterium]
MNINSELYAETAEFTTIDNRTLVKNFGDLPEEYKALREGSTIYDCGSYGLYSVKGENADAFLERLATKDIGFLNIGSITECYFLNEEANLVASVFILRREDDFIILATWEHADKALKWLQEKAPEYEVEVEDLSGSHGVLAIEGCKSWKVVKELFSVEIENIALHTMQVVDLEERPVTVIRVGRTSEYGYTIISDVETSGKIYKAFLAMKDNEEKEFPMRECGLDCLEIAMLEIRQPNFLRETKRFGNLMELGQQWFIRYDKEEYIGFEKVREILEAGVEKSTVGFICDAEDEAVLEPGLEVFIRNIEVEVVVEDEEDNDDSFFADDGEAAEPVSEEQVQEQTQEQAEEPYIPNEQVEPEKIGEVVYSLYSAKVGKVIGVAVIDQPYAQSGFQMLARRKDGRDVSVNTFSAPIVRPLSWDQKME